VLAKTTNASEYFHEIIKLIPHTTGRKLEDELPEYAHPWPCFAGIACYASTGL
jgi:hypothetical protein